MKKLQNNKGFTLIELIVVKATNKMHSNVRKYSFDYN